MAVAVFDQAAVTQIKASAHGGPAALMGDPLAELADSGSAAAHAVVPGFDHVAAVAAANGEASVAVEVSVLAALMEGVALVLLELIA